MQNLGGQTRFIMGDVQVAYTTVLLELDPIFGFLDPVYMEWGTPV